MKICKVLVVDDRPDEAARIAGYIRAQRDSLALKELELDLQVELSNSAVWALDTINQPHHWDLIFSDVMMPKELATRTVQREKQDDFDIWKRRGRDVPGDRFEEGGFLIAQGLANLRHKEPNTRNWPKLVLTSNHLDVTNRRIVDDFERQHRSWFRYLDKAEKWGSKERLYHFALLDALTTYHKPDWSDEAFHPATDKWQKLKLQAMELAGKDTLRHLLIVGPGGSGKFCLAKFLLGHRGITLSKEELLNARELGERKSKAVLDRHWKSSDGGLYITSPQMLFPILNGTFERQIKSDSESPGKGKRLCIWSAESLEAIHKSEFLDGALRGEFEEMKSLIVHPLSADDVEPHAKDMLERFRPSFTLTDGALQALKEVEWPNNLKSLRNALNGAVEAVRPGITELDKKHFDGLLANHRDSDTIYPPVQRASNTINKSVALEGMSTELPVMLDPKQITLLRNQFRTLINDEKNVKKTPSQLFDYVLSTEGYPDLRRYAADTPDVLEGALVVLVEARDKPGKAPNFKDAAISLLTNAEQNSFDAYTKKLKRLEKASASK